MDTFSKLALLSLAGVLGTLSRYLLSGFVQRLTGAYFPWGTWSVNILGCFLFGLVWVLSEERFYFSSQTRLIVLVGFMGAFTTFSTYVFESSELMRDGEWVKLSLNLAGQNVFGFLGLVGGMFLGRMV